MQMRTFGFLAAQAPAVQIQRYTMILANQKAAEKTVSRDATVSGFLRFGILLLRYIMIEMLMAS